MIDKYGFFPQGAATLVLAGISHLTGAQALVVTSVAPSANARAAAPTGSLVVTFNQPLAAASANALYLFSEQRGGLRSRPPLAATVSTNTLRFTPSAFPFAPGETVAYTVSTAASGGGGNLAQARVGHFTVAAGGTGKGSFQLGSTARVGNTPIGVVVGDADNDGDLDLFAANQSANTVSVRFNNGRGVFSGTQDVVVGGSPYGLVLGDVDGDLDFAVANYNSSPGTVSVRLNDGTGRYSGSQNVVVDYTPA